MAPSTDALATQSYDITSSSLSDRLCPTLTVRCIVVRVVGLPKLLFPWSFRAYVRIEVEDFRWSTQGAQWKNGGESCWEERTTLINLFNKPSKTSKAFLKIKLAGLLEISADALTKDISLSLPSGEKQSCKLILRITARPPITVPSSAVVVTRSETAALSSAIDPLEQISAQLSEPGPVVEVADAMSAVGATVAGLAQSDLVGTLTTLVGDLDFVLQLGDGIAKIHPWASLAWNVLSLGLKLVKAQQDRDNKIAALIQTMQHTYSVVVDSNIVDDGRLQDVLGRILKQTAFKTGKTISEAFSHTDALVAQYQGTFGQLLEEFRGRIATKTALMTIDIALEMAEVTAMVKDIRLDQVLEKLNPAEMNQSARKACLPGTQLRSIKRILDWYSDDSAESVMWLFGMAGAGKSTLSTTIARMMDSADGLNLLGAFFFFDRNIAQRNTSTLIRTIAYQLAQFDPIFGVRIQGIISKIPGIASMSLDIQFSKLLSKEALEDVPWSRGPILIIVDALDESGAEGERELLLQVLSEGVSRLPRFMRLLILSRRERDIMNYYDQSALRREELKVDAKENRGDIALFVRTRLHHTWKNYTKLLPEDQEDWPGDDEVDALVDLASGHFIWADIACRIIDGEDDPKGKLEDLIKHQPLITSDDSFDSLYQLYKIALETAVHWSHPAPCARARDLLGAVVCAQVPLSSKAVDDLLDQKVPFLHTVSRFGSVLDWTATGPIRIIHKSFYDYLTLHSKDEHWGLDVDQCHVHLAYGCIALLAKELRENMCNLTLPQPAEDVTLPEATSYAANFWIKHVCLVTNPSKDLRDTVDQFMRKHLLHWLEVLSIMKYNDVSSLLSKLLEYVQKHFPGSELYDFVQDADRFARYFIDTINDHPLLVYCSALPFTPHDTIIYKTFYHDGLPHVVAGVEPKWTTLLQAIYNHKGEVDSVALSPDGSRIALGLSKGAVQVWDTLTGQPALPLLEGHTNRVLSVSFSPDGSKIVSGSADGTVRVWDAATGQLALSPFRESGLIFSVAFSPDGSRIISGSSKNALQVWDALTGQPTLPPLEGHGGPIWAVSFSADRSRIVSGSDDKTILVWDALTGRRTTLPPIDNNESVWSVSFSPDGTRIVAELNDGSVRVWDACTGRPQEDETCHTRSPCRMNDSLAPAQISVYKDGFFVDPISGLYLSKVPLAIPLGHVVVGHHHPSCVLAKWISSRPQIPISITFPPR
ncbi:hypothetical protein HWV62_39409 [Athelia sp. TMB]|nr:hypothetical protein HWV62_39409 [Athelia sp. TMB]